MEWIVENWFGLIAGGLIVQLWIVARDRRKAVDRLVHEIELVLLPEGVRKGEAIQYNRLLKKQICLAGGSSTAHQDTPGRVIARSVERLTKENHER